MRSAQNLSRNRIIAFSARLKRSYTLRTPRGEARKLGTLSGCPNSEAYDIGEYRKKTSILGKCHARTSSFSAA